MLRVENLEGHSVALMAHSDDGYHFAVEDKPCMEPSDIEPFKTYEAKGIMNWVYNRFFEVEREKTRWELETEF